MKGDTTMANITDYVESEKEREEGHVDTRSNNFECDNKDPNLGCDPGIDVAGWSIHHHEKTPINFDLRQGRGYNGFALFISASIQAEVECYV